MSVSAIGNMSEAAVMMGWSLPFLDDRSNGRRSSASSVMIGERVTGCGDGGVVLDGFGGRRCVFFPFLGVTEQRRQCGFALM
ncbi:hypothetical protein Dimus_023927, partial [Dionaea muscipula]